MTRLEQRAFEMQIRSAEHLERIATALEKIAESLSKTEEDTTELTVCSKCWEIECECTPKKGK